VLEDADAVFFAYDGSNNDWVPRYAIRMASHDEDARLHLIHVNDGASSPEVIEDKIGRIKNGKLPDGGCLRK
jgi:hypothetical protein